MRLALAAVVALAASAAAGDHSPQLTLDGARAVFGASIRAGTMFQVGPYHFRIKRSEARSPRPGVFVVEIETEPVAP